jgi:thioredoxin 1
MRRRHERHAPAAALTLFSGARYSPTSSPCQSARFPKDQAMTLAVSDSSFETDVLKSAKPVLVDFWAEWCGPCKAIGPTIEQLSTDLGAKLTVAKMNIDDNPMTPTKYGVRGIPTLMLFRNGQVVATKVGALPKAQLYAWVESAMEAAA